MKFECLLTLLGKEPVFYSDLLTDHFSPIEVQKQLSRWQKSGRIIQIRKKLYCLAEPYRKRKPHPFFIAHRIKPISYVSLQSALAFHGIMEEPTEVQCITIREPELLSTPLGIFLFRQIKRKLFGGYSNIDVGEGQWAYMASPEKALLDLLYLHPHSDNWNWGYRKYLNQANIELLSEDRLRALVFESESEKLRRAASKVFLAIRAAKGRQSVNPNLPKSRT